MASQVSNFQFQNNALRVIVINGEPWFLAADVCRIIGIKNPTNAVKILDEDEVALKSFKGLTNGNDEANFISESGMYKIVVRSQDAIKKGTPAHAFTKWVTSEVLPAIRKTGAYAIPNRTIDKVQQGELATLIAERFPSGKDRPYAWSRFNNHFRLASYKDLPANRFKDACEYIKTMPEPVQALPKPETRSSINLFVPDEFMRVREIACKYLEDIAEKARGGNVTPSLEIPDEVLAGIVAMQMWKNNFTLGFNHEGKATIWKTPDPFDTVTKIISDPGWVNLAKIRQVFDACMTALSRRLGIERDE